MTDTDGTTDTDGARTYPHGVPCWLDLETRDVDGALAFYGDVFGWRFEDRLPPGAPGRYVVASLDGTDATAVAAIATPGPGGADDAEVTWNTYVAVDDLDAAVAHAAALGGTVVSAPERVGPPTAAAGWMARIRDPHGADVRLWHAGTRLGAQRVNEPGTWNFSHLRTPDTAAALAFYGPLLGWAVDPDLGAGMMRVPGYGDHLARTVDPDIHERQAFAPAGFADVVAGLVPDDGPARFEVRFTVADRDASVAAAERAGARVLSSADTEWTREAEVRDPQGAVLVLSQLAPPGDA